MIYTTREEIYEHEILPWIEKHKDSSWCANYYGVRRVITPRFPELPDGVVIEDFDAIIDTLMDYNLTIKDCQSDDNTRYTREKLTSNEFKFVNNTIQKAFVFNRIIDRVIELYGKPKKTTYALTPDDEWVEVKTCLTKEDL